MADWTAEGREALERQGAALKRALDECCAREQRFQNLFDSLLEGFALTEALLDDQGHPCDHRLLTINPAFERLTGCAREQAIGNTVKGLVPDIEPRWMALLERVWRTGEPVRVEDYFAPLGKWFEVVVYRPAPGQLAVLFMDITPRKQAEHALRESEAHHRREAAELELIYRTAPVGLAVLDNRLRYVRVNERLAQLNGRPAQAHFGKSVREVVPDIADHAEPLLRRVLETGEPVLEGEATAEVQAQPGEPRTLTGQYWPIKSSDGAVIGINAVVEDITERKRLEETRERERQFRMLAENSTDVIVRFDRGLRRIYANPTLEKLLQRPRSAILGKTNRELGLPAPVAETLDQQLEQVFRTGEARSIEAKLPTPGGERVFDSRLVPEAGPNGEVATLLAISRDITERTRAEETLRQHAEGQDFLVGTALRLLQPMGWQALFDFVTERIHRQAGGGMVVFSEFDPVRHRTIVRAVGCSDDQRERLRRLFGRDLVGLTFNFSEPVRARMLPGQFEQLKDGVCELAFYQLPQALCEAVERELDIRSVYAMACSVEQDLLGTVAVATQEAELPHQRLIESIVTQAALALKRKRVEEALRAERDFINAVFDTQGAIVAVLDREHRVIRLNRAYYTLAGAPAGSGIGNPFRELMHPSQADAVERQIADLKDSTTIGTFESLLQVREGPPRHISWRTTVQRDEQGRIDCIIATGIDITARRQMEERTRHLAEHDALTDLPNRRLLIELLETTLRAARRHRRKVALLFLDLDRFKTINDTLGHEAGDALLKSVATRLSARLRRSDVIGRLGGDEFTVLAPDLARGEQAGEVAAEIVRAFQRPFQLGDQTLYVTTSIGISLFPDDSDSAAGLLRRADLAMYEAKDQGRNTYRFYNPAVDRRARERVQIESALRQALAQGGLRVVYQPEFDLRSGRLLGVEALVRWHHPELGLLDPGRFIPVAEETDLIVALDDWVLHTACMQARHWLDQGYAPIDIGVNLSARRFERPELVEVVQRCLDESGLAAEHLELELTERTVMRRVDQSIERMRELVALGVCIAVDDFGTGYSSLSYLKRLPIGKLKIDQSFVRDIATDADDRAIVEAVTALAHVLNKRVIAEGVETTAQRDFLTATGCDEAQGYLFNQPLPPEALARLLVQ